MSASSVSVRALRTRTGARTQVYPRTSGRVCMRRVFDSDSQGLRLPAAFPNRGTRDVSVASIPEPASFALTLSPFLAVACRSCFSRLVLLSKGKTVKHLLLALCAACLWAQNSSHVNLDSLMNLQFYPDGKGRFRVDGLAYIFPQGRQTGQITLTKGGKQVGRAGIVGQPRPETAFSNAFGVISPGPDSPAGFFDADGPGDYTMNVELGGKSIGSYNFKLAGQTAGDPFAKPAGLLRTGPWSGTAIIGRVVEFPNEPLHAGVWMNIRDLPGYQAGKRTPFTAQILKGAQELAFVEGSVTDDDWTYYNMILMKGTRATKGPFTWADLTKTPGDYSLAIRVNGAIAKQWPFKVANGSIARIPQNELNYSGPGYLAPQGVQNTQGTYMREERYWLAPVR